MQSSRDQGKVEILMPCQTHDPGRLGKGSFMVHPISVKKSGQTKTVPNPHFDPDYDDISARRLAVFRAANHVTVGRHGVMHEPHPDAFDFAVYYGKRR